MWPLLTAGAASLAGLLGADCVFSGAGKTAAGVAAGVGAGGGDCGVAAVPASTIAPRPSARNAAATSRWPFVTVESSSCVAFAAVRLGS